MHFTKVKEAKPKECVLSDSVCRVHWKRQHSKEENRTVAARNWEWGRSCYNGVVWRKFWGDATFCVELWWWTHESMYLLKPKYLPTTKSDVCSKKTKPMLQTMANEANCIMNEAHECA